MNHRVISRYRRFRRYFRSRPRLDLETRIVIVALGTLICVLAGIVLLTAKGILSWTPP